MITKDVFGKPFKDMTYSEKRTYFNFLWKKNYKPRYDGFHQWCINYFGKRKRDLSPSERKEYYRIRKQIQRNRIKEGVHLGKGYYNSDEDLIENVEKYIPNEVKNAV